MSNSVRPHRWQPTRLPRPWDSPGKNTGAGCHFLLQCMKLKSESEVAQSCLTLSDTMDCSLPGTSTHGIFQTRVLEWGALVFSWLIIKWSSCYATGGSVPSLSRSTSNLPEPRVTAIRKTESPTMSLQVKPSRATPASSLGPCTLSAESIGPYKSL